MKKLFFSIIAVTALTLTGCGNKAKNNANAPAGNTNETEVVDASTLSAEARESMDAVTKELTNVLNTNNTEALPTALANIAATYKAFVNAGQLENARTYGALIKNFVNQNVEKIKKLVPNNATINNLLTNINNLPTATATTLEEAKNAVSNDIVSLASDGVRKAAGAGVSAEEAAEAIKSMPAAVATETAGNAIQNAKEAVDEAANKVTDDAKRKANDAAKQMEQKVDEAKQKANKAGEKAKAEAGKAIDNAAAKAKKGLGL